MYQILLNEQNDIGDIIYAETESTWSVKNTVHMSITLFTNDVMGGEGGVGRKVTNSDGGEGGGQPPKGHHL